MVSACARPTTLFQLEDRVAVDDVTMSESVAVPMACRSACCALVTDIDLVLAAGPAHAAHVKLAQNRANTVSDALVLEALGVTTTRSRGAVK